MKFFSFLFLIICSFCTTTRALTVAEFKVQCEQLQAEASVAAADSKKVKIRTLYIKIKALSDHGIGKTNAYKISMGYKNGDSALSDPELEEMKAFAEQILANMTAGSEELQKFYTSLQEGTIVLRRF